MIEINFPIKKVNKNPWQPRQSEDQEHIRNLALSIANDGLLQKPLGRIVDIEGVPVKLNDVFSGPSDPERKVKQFYFVQLAFGHSRLSAFQWLEDSAVIGYWSEIPVILKDLTDEEMFRLAITENLQRKELNPIEEAAAMTAYRDDFGKTSQEIGDLFGLSDSAVRNKLRLLRLPADIQAWLKNGTITEGVGRALVGLFDVDEEKRLAEEDKPDSELKPSTILEAAASGISPSQVYELIERFKAKFEPKIIPGQTSIYDIQPDDQPVGIPPNPEPKIIPVPDPEENEVSDEEMEEMIGMVLEDIYQRPDNEDNEENNPSPPEYDHEKLLQQAREMYEKNPNLTTSTLQREFRVAYSVAAMLLEKVKEEKRKAEKAEAESKPDQPVPAVEPEPVKEPEKPKTWEESIISVSLQFFQDDGHPLGRNVSVGIRINQNLPKIFMVREQNLVLPEPLSAVLNELKMEFAA